MSCCSIPTAISGLQPAKNQVYPQLGQGLYIGGFMPGTNTPISTITGTSFNGLPTDGSLIIGTGGFVSTLTEQPQNVLRLTGAFGTSFIQGSNIAFAMPFSGTAGVRILPSTNQINVNNIQFVSTIAPIGTGGVGLAGQINMTQLASSIRGYGWAQVL